MHNFAPFWKSKKDPDFGKKGPDCVHLWVKFAIQKVYLRVSTIRNSKMFPCGLSGIFSTRFLGMYRHIQSYSALLRHIQAYWDIIKIYSSLFRHIQYPLQPWHIHNLAILWVLAYLEQKAYLKTCETLIRHIPNSAIVGHYSAILRYIQNLVQGYHMQKPGILEILEYSELFHNCTRCIFNTVLFTKIYEYLELWHIKNATHIQNLPKDLRCSFLQNS